MTATASQLRLKLAACSLGIVLMVFWQSPADTATDTKFDLVISPWRFLNRALTLWDPITNAGVMQNQAYGYVFPMGPFFGVLHSLDLPPWVVQRSWEAALLVAAFLGVVRLARLLGIEGFWPRVGAGLLYALAPRMLSELTSISSELMPVAALPWIMIPLVRGSVSGSTRSAGLRSGVALLFAGGVNAGATVAILPAPVLFLLTRSRGPRRASLMRWWIAGAVMGGLWWIIPLLTLGRYSPPFLDWIENSAVTTQVTSLFNTLRGVVHWESYLGPEVWPAAWIFASSQIAIVATAVIAGLALAGLSRSDVRYRSFLWLCLVIGLVLLSLGHAGPAGPIFDADLRSLLDGPLVPFRNVHKFDPLVRLPLAIGLGHLLSRMASSQSAIPANFSTTLRGHRIELPLRRYAGMALVALALVAVSPAVSGRLVSNPRITAEPGWWRSTGQWLADHSGGRRALVVPATAAPAYLWGSTVDDALQPVARTPWTTRDAVPLTQPGYIRFLDSVEQILGTGQGSPHLAELLSRAGIGFVVLRNDLNTFRSVSVSTTLVRSTLSNSPGFARVVSYGPQVGGSTQHNNVIDGGLGVPRPSVEVFEVTPAPDVVAINTVNTVLGANGSADLLPSLLAAGVPRDRPILFGPAADEVPLPDGQRIRSDGIRRQEASFGNLLTKTTTLADGEPYESRRRVHDYLPSDAVPLSEFTYVGLKSVSVSSSGASQFALVNRSPGNGAWSAIDGDAATAWRSSSFTGAVGQWIRVELTGEREIGSILVSFTPGLGSMPTKLAVVTDRGYSVVGVQPVSAPQPVTLPAGPTRTITLRIAEVANRSRGTQVGISELRIPGEHPIRALKVSGSGTPAMMSFSATPGYRSPCLSKYPLLYCVPTVGSEGEEDDGINRLFHTDLQASYVPSALVHFRPGALLDGLLDKASATNPTASKATTTTATASSTFVPDPRVRASAAVDGDPNTYWRAAAGDPTPTLKLHLPRARLIEAIGVETNDQTPGARPVAVRLQVGDASWHGTLPPDGVVHLDHRVTASDVTVEVTESQVRSDTDSTYIRTTIMSTAINEVVLLPPGTDDPAGTSPARIKVGCNEGLSVRIDNVVIPMLVDAPVSDVLAGRDVPARACSPTVDVPSGEHLLQAKGSPLLMFAAVSFARSGSTLTTVPSADSARASVLQWGRTERTVRVDTTAASILNVRENFNVGWQASLAGTRLKPVMVDGWQQGWLVPAGATGEVVLTFAPQRPFVLGLVVGGLTAVALVALAFAPTRSSPWPGLGDLRPGFRAYCVAGLSCGFVLAGWQGAMVAATVMVALWLLPYEVRSRLGLAAVPAMLIAAATVSFGSYGALFSRANSTIVQLTCIAALLCAATAGGPPRQDRLK